MKLQQKPQFNMNYNSPNAASKSKNQVAFKGAETVLIQALKFLDTNQAWGAIGVDVGCMGVPRTTVDFTRGPAAGFETMRREFSSTINHSLIGIYGTIAAFAFAQAMNHDFGIKAHKLFVSDEMIDILGHAWHTSKDHHDPMKAYLEEVIPTIKGFSPELEGVDDNGWKQIDKASSSNVVERLLKEIKEGPEKISKETMEYLKTVIGSSVGSESKIKITRDIEGKALEANSSLDSVIENIYKVSKTLAKDKVAEAFKTSDFAGNTFIKGLKKLNSRASLGLGIAMAIGMSLQPLNAYLTKLKTGQSGFVGVEGREPDKTNSFKILKTAFALAFGAVIIRTIGPFKEILGRIRFKGLTPTIPQFKLIYGTTIMSRLIAARDKNELRESSIKDSLGFVNWLILGGFVSKLTAAVIEKATGEKYIRYNKNENGKNVFDWLTKSNIVTRDEILLEELKKAGISAIKDGKAMTFKEMFEVAPKLAKTKVRYLGLIQFAGYLYSGIALGVGIPKLNIAITKTVENKRKAKEAANIENNKAVSEEQKA